MPSGGCNGATQFVPKSPLWHQAEDALQLRLQPHLACVSLFFPASTTPLSPESFIHKSFVQKHKLKFPTKDNLSVEIVTLALMPIVIQTQTQLTPRDNIQGMEIFL